MVYGIAGPTKFQLGQKFALSPRAEWLSDKSGGPPESDSK